MLESLLTSPYLLWPIIILAAAFIFSLAVFIHEFGHFIAARLLGLKADVFSIGFGPALWKRQFGATEWRISAIPFGGYVSLPQLDPEGMKQIQGDHSETLPPAAPWKRIIVAIAGPMGNIVLALVCATCIALFSPPKATGATTTLGYVGKNTSAGNAGLLKGDTILSVNNTPVETWMEFQTECFLSGTTNDVVQITYERETEQYTTQAVLDTQVSPNESIYVVGGCIPGNVRYCVLEIIPGSPAEAAGLQPMDSILAINGTPFEALDLYSETPPFSDDKPVTLQLKRGEEIFEVTFEPKKLSEEDDKPRFGFLSGLLTDRTFPWMANRGIYEQIKGDVTGIVRILRALTMPKTKGERGRAAKGLGGPLMIFAVLMQVIQMGFWTSLGFLRLICINLAFINLLPLPVLDGGHVLFALYALIRRKEISAKVLGYITTAFSILLLLMMAWFLFSDVRRFVLNLFS